MKTSLSWIPFVIGVLVLPPATISAQSIWIAQPYGTNVSVDFLKPDFEGDDDLTFLTGDTGGIMIDDSRHTRSLLRISTCSYSCLLLFSVVVIEACPRMA